MVTDEQAFVLLDDLGGIMAVYTDGDLLRQLRDRTYGSLRIRGVPHNPLAEQIRAGQVPWRVYVNVMTNETQCMQFDRITDQQEVEYYSGNNIATIRTLACSDEEAERIALDLWRQHAERANLKPTIVWEVEFDDQNEIIGIQKVWIFGYHGTKQVVRFDDNKITVRVDTLAEAIEYATTQYRELLSKES